MKLIHKFAHVSHHNPKDFCDKCTSRIEEMQNEYLEVEVQYCPVNTVYSAVIIGRKET